MTDQPTPTPRTDLHSVHWVQQGGLQSTEVVLADFARELERELSAERALADRLAGQMERWRELVGDLCTPSAADEALAAWKEARRG